MIFDGKNSTIFDRMSSMVLERKSGCYTEISATWDKAVASHQRAVEMAEAGLIGLA